MLVNRTPVSRLAVAAELVPPGSRVADIGTDHGLLPRILLSSGRASFCVASERSAELLPPPPPPSVDSRGVEWRSGDGLTVLRPEDRIDVVTLTGMGARTISRLLDRSVREPLGVRRFVLQPQTEELRLRRWLVAQGLGIVDERLVVERRRFYVVLAVEPGAATALHDHPSLSPQELLEAGPVLVRSADPRVRDYWTRESARLEGILAEAPEGPGKRAASRRAATARRIVEALPRDVA